MGKRRRRDRRRDNPGITTEKLVSLRQQILEKQSPPSKTYKSHSGAHSFAHRMLRTTGQRYQVFNVGTKRKPAYDAVLMDTPADDVQRSTEFKRLLHTMETERNRNANGPLARALVDMGLRDKDATWPVGETPST